MTAIQNKRGGAMSFARVYASMSLALSDGHDASKPEDADEGEGKFEG